jgi:hypothetical protein
VAEGDQYLANQLELIQQQREKKKYNDNNNKPLKKTKGKATNKKDLPHQIHRVLIRQSGIV